MHTMNNSSNVEQTRSKRKSKLANLERDLINTADALDRDPMDKRLRQGIKKLRNMAAKLRKEMSMLDGDK